MTAGEGASARAPWWASGQERADTTGATAAHEATGEPLTDAFHGPECQVCPVCSVLRLLGVGRPEVARHLSDALRHITLAAKAVLEANADGAHDSSERPSSERFERIRVDE